MTQYEVKQEESQTILFKTVKIKRFKRVKSEEVDFDSASSDSDSDGSMDYEEYNNTSTPIHNSLHRSSSFM